MANVTGDSAEAAVPAILGTNTSGDRNSVGVEGVSEDGHGVFAHSTRGRGVVATSVSDYAIRAHSDTSSAIRADSNAGVGVEASSITERGIVGSSKSNVGVEGASEDGHGVFGHSTHGRGVVATSVSDYAVRAHSDATSAIRADSNLGVSIEASSNAERGIVGSSKSRDGVWGVSEQNGIGVLGTSDSGVGVQGKSNSGSGVYGTSVSGAAGFFQGNVVVTGDISLTHGDCAEDFEIAPGCSAEPGTVMVLGDEDTLQESFRAYDKRVAGVISGAGTYKPGIVLDKQQSHGNRKPVALLGKVFCKADARFGPIGVGDLLTTSTTPGHAMRVDDPLKAVGAVIGKSLRPLADGRGLIPILVALQ